MLGAFFLINSIYFEFYLFQQQTKKLFENFRVEISLSFVSFSLNLFDFFFTNNFRSIALDPVDGILYWSTWTSESTDGQIMMSWMDGTHKSVFVEKCVDGKNCLEIEWPSSLTIDLNDRKLYWCDPRIQTIERINLNGKNREVIIKGSFMENFYPFSVASHNDFIYFTDISSGNIMKFHLKDAYNRS